MITVSWRDLEQRMSHFQEKLRKEGRRRLSWPVVVFPRIEKLWFIGLSK
jgi:hypothetical protein